MPKKIKNLISNHNWRIDESVQHFFHFVSQYLEICRLLQFKATIWLVFDSLQLKSQELNFSHVNYFGFDLAKKSWNISEYNKKGMPIMNFMYLIHHSNELAPKQSFKYKYISFFIGTIKKSRYHIKQYFCISVCN